MQQLIEGVLSVRSGFSEDHRPGGITDRFAEAVHALAVRFHIHLLQMRGKTAQGLAVRKHGCSRIAQDVPFVNADQRIEHRRVLHQILFRCQFVFFRRALQEPSENFRSECQGEYGAADRRGGGIASADIIVHKERGKVIAALCQRRRLAGYCDHVLRGVQSPLLQGVLHKCLVRQGLQRGTALGHKNEDGVFRVRLPEHACCVVRVHIADELCVHSEAAVFLCPVFQRQVHGPGPQVAAADTDLNDRSKGFSLLVGDFTAMYFSGKSGDFFLLLCVEGTLVDAVRGDGFSELSAGQLVKHQPFFTGIDDGAIVQLFEFFSQAAFIRQGFQLCKHGVVNLFCGIGIHKACSHGNLIRRHAGSAFFPGQFFPQIYPPVFFFHFLK